MKVKDMIKALGKANPEAEVVRSGSDHGYNVVNSVVRTTAGKAGRVYFEWHGEENASFGEKPVPVVLIE